MLVHFCSNQPPLQIVLGHSIFVWALFSRVTGWLACISKTYNKILFEPGPILTQPSQLYIADAFYVTII